MNDAAGATSEAVSVTYHLSNSLAQMLGGLIGINLGMFSRSSKMW